MEGANIHDKPQWSPREIDRSSRGLHRSRDREWIPLQEGQVNVNATS